VAKTVLGIDIGSSSIKFVQLTKSFRGQATARFLEKPIPSSLPDAQATDSIIPEWNTDLAKIIKDSIEEKRFASDEYITSLPSKLIMVREVKLPFKEAAKIRQVIKFEIEQSLPFPPEEVVVDFLVSDENQENALITAFCLHKRNLSNHLSILNAAGIEPKVITIDSFPILRALKESVLNLEGVIVHIDLGAKNTTVNIFRGGEFAYTRAIPKAGNFITTKIKNRFEISFEEAETLKKDPVVDLASPYLSDTVQIISKALEEIATEISYTINSFRVKKGEYPVNKILLSGGTSSLKGVAQFLGNKLNSNVSLFLPKSFFEVSGIEQEQAINTPIFHISLGLAALETDDEIRRINLRREEYVFKSIDKKVKNNIKYAAGLLGAIIVLSGFNLTFDLFQKKNENKDVEKRIMSIYREMLPTGNVVNEVVQAEQYIGKVKEEFRKFQQIMETKSTPLEVMRELSTTIPKDFQVKILNLSLREKKLEIKGEAANLESVDKLQNMLKLSPLFKDIKISSIQMNQIQNIAEFTLDIELN